MKFNRTLIASAIALSGGLAGALASSSAAADCGIAVEAAQISILGNEFPAIQAVVGAAEGCATDSVTFASNLTKEHREIQVAALTANPSEYSVAVVANSTLVTLMNDGLVRPLNSLIDEHAPDLPSNLKITVGDDVMAIAFMANAQHLMYRADILEAAGVDVPATYEDVLAAAEAIKEQGLVDYPLTGTYQSGWNLAEEFVNMLMGHGGDMFKDGTAEPNLDSDEAKATLAMMKSLTEYMNPDYLTFDSTAAVAEFEQGKAAMMNMWGSRAGSVLDDEGAAEGVVENIGFAAAPTVGGGDIPASTLWWDGFTIATNTSDENAAASFQAMLSGVTDEVANANADSAVWLMAGYEPTQAAEGVLATAEAGAQPYPMLPYIGLMHTALGNELVEFLQGSESAEQALADTEAAYRAAAEEAGFL
jgi:ABC-type glycerol-3-phosphate transport system substrate-binding protein